ncbi:unnamed protein product [Phytophthora fragariaefolia]|uniref:Unnamed protein product n=1 Tax=Phytophthora fragariaefolia TaxID=1490495 RepID=A0A9W6XQ89_9STRA|nr:unnamed protein product [Phytophthora fragariaefolia]
MEDLFGSKLKLDLSISYFHLANEIIKRNGVSDLFAGDDGAIRKCKVLVKLLPANFLRKVKNELDSEADLDEILKNYENVQHSGPREGLQQEPGDGGEVLDEAQAEISGSAVARRTSKHEGKPTASNDEAARLCRIRERLPLEGGTVLLEGVISVPFCADSGASMSIMSECVFEKLVEVCPGVACVELEKPITCTTVGDDVEANRAENVQVTLQTVYIGTPVRCLILPGDLGEFPLCKESLASLGIDVDQELELLAAKGQEEDLEESDERKVRSTPELSAELEKLVRALVDKAKQRGFPVDYLRELE